MAVLDHHGVVEERHVGHAAVRVTRIEIGAEHAGHYVCLGYGGGQKKGLFVKSCG